MDFNKLVLIQKCKAQEFVNTPDLALVKMKEKLSSFSDFIRPICLANKDVAEEPVCPDNSADRSKQEFSCKKLYHQVFSGANNKEKAANLGKLIETPNNLIRSFSQLQRAYTGRMCYCCRMGSPVSYSCTLVKQIYISKCLGLFLKSDQVLTTWTSITDKTN